MVTKHKKIIRPIPVLSKQKRIPIHKRLALHPINVLFLLCVGILLCDFTFIAHADSYTVTGKVPAPPLTTPAVLTYPTDGMSFKDQAITVTGACPSNSYVTLTDNGAFIGTDICSGNGTFSIGLDLSNGTNILTPQDFNLTDDPGPASTAITVSYTPPPQPQVPAYPPTTPNGPVSPISVPQVLQVLQLDIGVPFTANPIAVSATSLQPTFTGIAPPFSEVQVNVQTIICATTANAQGYWSCRLPKVLTGGLQRVFVTARLTSGRKLSIPALTIRAVGTSTPQIPKTALQLKSSYTYHIYPVGQNISFPISITGGYSPYAITVDWGDGTTATFLKQQQGMLTISHSYGWQKESTVKKTVKIQIVDAAGNVQTLQLIAIVRNPVAQSPIASATKSSGLWGLYGAVRPWLWLFWPGYVVVLIAVLSFWLGERQRQLELENAARHNKRLRHQTHGR